MAETKQSDKATEASESPRRPAAAPAAAGAPAAPTESSPEPVKDAGTRGEGVDKPEPGQAVVSTTSEVPHEADASSAPGPYADLPIDRPPVSTSRADQPIAQSLVEGAGAGNQGQPEIPPEKQRPENLDNV